MWRSPKRPKGRCRMNKAVLVHVMVKKVEERGKTKLTLTQSRAAVTAMTEAVTDALKSGEKVILPGFGMFAVRTRPAHQGRNNFTGEELFIPERRMPAFKAGKTLKDAVAAE